MSVHHTRCVENCCRLVVKRETFSLTNQKSERQSVRLSVALTHPTKWRRQAAKQKDRKDTAVNHVFCMLPMLPNGMWQLHFTEKLQKNKLENSAIQLYSAGMQTFIKE